MIDFNSLNWYKAPESIDAGFNYHFWNNDAVITFYGERMYIVNRITNDKFLGTISTTEDLKLIMKLLNIN